jgi:hypothetical protein
MKARNGQGTWLAFKAHYRGSNEVGAIEAAAEKALESRHYTGEKPTTTSKCMSPSIRRRILTSKRWQERQWPRIPKYASCWLPVVAQQ